MQSSLGQMQSNFGQMFGELRSIIQNKPQALAASDSHVNASSEEQQTPEINDQSVQNVDENDCQSSSNTEIQSARKNEFDELSIKDRAFLEALKSLKVQNDENSRRRPRYQEPPEFDGSFQSAIRWLREFELAAKNNEWDGRSSINAAYAKMKGHAKQWFRVEIMDQCDDTWDNFKSAFLKEYDPMAQEIAINLQLAKCFQMFNENPTHYMYRVLDLCKQMDSQMSEREQLRHILSGLKIQYREQLAASGDSTSLTRCKEALRRIGNASQSRPAQQNSGELANPPRKEFSRKFNSPVCYNCNGNHLVRECTYPRDQSRIETARQMLANQRKGPTDKNSTQIKTILSKETEGYKQQPECESDWIRFNTLTSNAAEEQEGDHGSLITKKEEEIQRRIGEKIAMAANKADCPIVYTSVNNKRTKTLIDTGSVITAISTNLWKSLDIPMYSWTARKLRVADGRTLEPSGVAEVTVEYHSRPMKIEVAVIDTANPDVILGSDYCRQMGIVVDFETSKVYFKHELEKEVKNIPSVPSQCTGHWDQKTLENMDNFGHEEDACLADDPFAYLYNDECQIDISDDNSLIVNEGNRTEETICPTDVCDATDTVSDVHEMNDDEFMSHFNIGEMLNNEEKKELGSVLREYRDCFSFSMTEIGLVDCIKHKIDTGDNLPINLPPYRLSATEREIVDDFVKELVDAGICSPSLSPWAFPIVLVPKPGSDKPRMVIDYRRLNKITTPLVHPITNFSDFLHMFNNKKYFATMDVFAMYHQIAVEEKDKPKTAFVTPSGHYQFERMPFGLQGAPATSANAVKIILGDIMYTIVAVYFDDILTGGATFDEFKENLIKVFSRLRKHNLKLKPSKCNFGLDKVCYLGREISADGIRPDPEKVKVVKEWLPPKNQKEVKSILGFASFHRDHIEKFAEITESMTQLIRKNAKFDWTKQRDKDFERLKEKLTSAPVLAHFDPEAQLELRTDACGYAIGGVLLQHKDGKTQVLCYMSRSLNKHERNYSNPEKEALAAVWCMGKIRQYTFGKHTIITTDSHSLCWLLTVKDANGRLVRWSLKLQPYSFEIRYKAGRLHTDADCISRHVPVPVDDENDNIDLPFNLLQTEYTVADIKESQEGDEFCIKMVKILKGENASKRVQRRQQTKYEVKDGVLYKITYVNKKVRSLLVVPKAMQEYVIMSCHDLPTAGHFGVLRTYIRIRQRFYFQKMIEKVKKWIASCKTCQLRKQQQNTHIGEQQPIPVNERIFGTIFADIFGPITESADGHKYVLVIVDQLSKYCVAIPLHSFESETTVKTFHKYWVLRFGYPDVVITDNGRNFVSEYTEYYFNASRIKHKTSSPFHPKGHSPVERMIRTMQEGLAKLVSAEHKDWHEKLDEFIFAYNTSVHSSTGSSPHALCFGCEPKIEVEVALQVSSDGFDDRLSNIKKFTATITETRKAAKTLIQAMQAKNKAIADSKCARITFNVGDLVLLRRPQLKVGRSKKLMNRFIGPLRVTKKIGSINYEVINMRGAFRKIICHVSQMKKFVERDEMVITDSESDNESNTEEYDVQLAIKNSKISDGKSVAKKLIQKTATKQPVVKRKYVKITDKMRRILSPRTLKTGRIHTVPRRYNT
ncbi:pol polyprotein-like protein [Leptotrombidium deliense]|uniref:RNA-directed DNA polymerase n=1 Tax=Leptotrombidium deliense TaxID=299467 RepID=A0A443SF46_9ACAR|nr:pol polyprotein-like protein [Leptotrombidium deliense]